jgi:hypothetical protein
MLFVQLWLAGLEFGAAFQRAMIGVGVGWIHPSSSLSLFTIRLHRGWLLIDGMRSPRQAWRL